MWKWVTVLCLGMYVTLMAFGGEGYNPETVAEENVEPAPVVVKKPVALAAVDPTVAPEISSFPEPVVIPEAVVDAPLPVPTQPATVEVTSTEIEAIAPVTEPITITAAPQATITRESTLVDAPKPELPIWRVTGSRVNLRAEANGQAQIVGRTVRGDSAEIIELLPSGWAKVYIIDSGIEAYMSADYIAPEG